MLLFAHVTAEWAVGVPIADVGVVEKKQLKVSGELRPYEVSFDFDMFNILNGFKAYQESEQYTLFLGWFHTLVNMVRCMILINFFYQKAVEVSLSTVLLQFGTVTQNNLMISKRTTLLVGK